MTGRGVDPAADPAAHPSAGPTGDPGAQPTADPAVELTAGPSAELLARVAWSRLAEPNDAVASAVTSVLGVQEALEWLHHVARTRPTAPAAVELPSGLALPGTLTRRLARGALRWAPRLEGLDPVRDVDAVVRLGGGVLVPGGPGWPTGLDDLGAGVPFCLWVRGELGLGALTERSVAVIGARACTAYGEHVAGEMSAALTDAGVTVVSGGAYGIDAAAHRGALAAGGATVAFLAGGVDRAYPAGNARLLRAMVEGGGALVSEVPPGSVPTRSRFLERNRLIAGAARVTVVVEAAWRSGALSTARHAFELLRPVGAVPGPVTSVASAGCHRLLRDGGAVCVTDPVEVRELLESVTAGPAPEPEGAAARPHDGLRETERRTLDALPVRSGAPVESLARTAGLAVEEVRAALGVLELGGHAVQHADRWRLASGADPARTGTSRSSGKSGRPGIG